MATGAVLSVFTIPVHSPYASSHRPTLPPSQKNDAPVEPHCSTPSFEVAKAGMYVARVAAERPYLEPACRPRRTFHKERYGP